jgi:hypothetical protein
MLILSEVLSGSGGDVGRTHLLATESLDVPAKLTGSDPPAAVDPNRRSSPAASSWYSFERETGITRGQQQLVHDGSPDWLTPGPNAPGFHGAHETPRRRACVSEGS